MMPESERIEYKQSLNRWREVVESVAAFARATGGVIHVGVSPEGDRVGVRVGQAMAFVARNTQQAIRITGKPEREIIPEYPEEAVREAVLNAICHRDYATVGTVQVRIYSDRLEVWNPGRLPPDLTIEALYREHHSHPRNPLIADAFYRARLIEHWGTGTLRMIRECEARGMPRPEFFVRTERL